MNLITFLRRNLPAVVAPFFFSIVPAFFLWVEFFTGTSGAISYFRDNFSPLLGILINLTILLGVSAFTAMACVSLYQLWQEWQYHLADLRYAAYCEREYCEREYQDFPDQY